MLYLPPPLDLQPHWQPSMILPVLPLQLLEPVGCHYQTWQLKVLF